jgi:hypothetical protein
MPEARCLLCHRTFEEHADAPCAEWVELRSVDGELILIGVDGRLVDALEVERA